MTAMLVRFPVKTRNPLNGSLGLTRGAAMAYAGERRRHRELARLLVTARRTSLPAPPYLVTLTRVSAGTLDDDAAAASCKSLRDGIADALGFDDGDLANLRFVYRQRKGKQRHYEVECLIEGR